MKKLFAVCFLMYVSISTLFSQDGLNIGFGTGHQFGLLGIRTGYLWKRLEYSINFGTAGVTDEHTSNLTKLQMITYCVGTGLSYRITKQTSLAPGYLTYNYGVIFLKEWDGYNHVLVPRSVNTLTLNYNISFRDLFIIRIGGGLAYIPKTVLNKKIIPSFALGAIFPLKK